MKFEYSPKAHNFIQELEKNEGEIVLLLSHGCCDGSSVFCTLKEDFKSLEAYEKIATISKTDFFIPKSALSFLKTKNYF